MLTWLGQLLTTEGLHPPPPLIHSRELTKKKSSQAPEEDVPMWRVFVRCRQNLGLVALAAVVAVLGGGAAIGATPTAAAPQAAASTPAPDCAFCWD
jgi:hypothetical protein